jgi:AcrR family transcriptional regulator
VVEGALAVLDAEGVDGLTTRRLGAALGVQGTALYRHFPTKGALLDAVAERLLEGVGDPLPEGSWRDQLSLLAERLRAALLAHRDGARLVAGTYVGGPNTMAAAQAAVEVMCSAGLPPDRAGRLSFALFYYVLGHVIEEQALPQLPDGIDWRSRLEPNSPVVSSRFAKALDSLAIDDPAERFTYGLTVFLDGIAGQLPNEAATRRPSGRPR